MEVVYDPKKDNENIRKHHLSLALAEYLIEDPLLAIVHDRFEIGEDRWHAIGTLAGKCLLLVHAYPDPDNQDRIRAISLREATKDERRQYENEDLY